VEASRFAAHDSEPIILLVPRVISGANPVEDPHDSQRLTNQYRGLAASAGVEASVRLCICRHYRDMFRWMLVRPSLIVIGGRRRWRWPTAAQRMAEDLTRSGHAVLFADVG
jgi:hypothetical protein